MIADQMHVIVINPADPLTERVVHERVLAAGIPLIAGNHSTPCPAERGLPADDVLRLLAQGRGHRAGQIGATAAIDAFVNPVIYQAEGLEFPRPLKN